jgi:hypothetical protein
MEESHDNINNPTWIKFHSPIHGTIRTIGTPQQRIQRRRTSVDTFTFQLDRPGEVKIDVLSWEALDPMGYTDLNHDCRISYMAATIYVFSPTNGTMYCISHFRLLHIFLSFGLVKNMATSSDWIE